MPYTKAVRRTGPAAEKAQPAPRASPVISGLIKLLAGSLPGSSPTSGSGTWKVSAIRRRVSRLGWQPPMSPPQGRARGSCQRARRVPSRSRTCAGLDDFDGADRGRTVLHLAAQPLGHVGVGLGEHELGDRGGRCARFNPVPAPISSVRPLAEASSRARISRRPASSLAANSRS